MVNMLVPVNSEHSNFAFGIGVIGHSLVVVSPECENLMEPVVTHEFTQDYRCSLIGGCGNHVRRLNRMNFTGLDIDIRHTINFKYVSNERIQEFLCYWMNLNPLEVQLEISWAE